MMKCSTPSKSGIVRRFKTERDSILRLTRRLNELGYVQLQNVGIYPMAYKARTCPVVKPPLFMRPVSVPLRLLDARISMRGVLMRRSRDYWQFVMKCGLGARVRA